MKHCLIGLLLMLGVSLVVGCSNESNMAYKPTVAATPQPVEDEGMRRVCTMDVKRCSDGSFVSRDSSAGCAFRACPK